MFSQRQFAAYPSAQATGRSYIRHAFSGKLCKGALLIIVACMFAACSDVPQGPAYDGWDTYAAPTGVGTGDIHALSDGNLIW